jgi:Transcriptional regulator, AbiEi antitoxin, Type IV TA system
MTHTENSLIPKARETLDRILRQVPGVKELEWDLDQRSDQKELASLADMTVGVKTEHRLDTIVVEFGSQGHPRQMRQAMERLFRYRFHSRRNDYPVVAAPYITADGAAVCMDEKVGYYDLAGNCRLAFGPYFIERTGNPNPFRKNQVTATPRLYAAKSERVLRALFADTTKAWKVVPLAESVHVSLGTVSTVRTLLLEREWAKETADGIQLTQPEKLLADWAIVWARRRERPMTFFTMTPLADTERQMAGFARQQKRPFALTGTAGAWRMAAMTKYVRTQAYWEGDPTELAEGVGLKPAETGANVHLLVPRDEGVFFQLEEFDGIPIVAPLQLYLDLQRDPARGEEAAEHLWRTKLFPRNAHAK